jgi:hypothetical protein
VAYTIVAMVVEPSEPFVAELWLRGASGPVHARLRAPRVPSDAPLVVALGDTGTDAGTVTLRLPEGLQLDDAHAALCWAADHARELGASSGGLVLAAAGDAMVLGRRLAERAAADGWPDIAQLVLEPR